MVSLWSSDRLEALDHPSLWHQFSCTAEHHLDLECMQCASAATPIWSICGHMSSSGTPKVSFSCDPENASSKLEMRMVVTCILRVLRLTWTDSSFFVICCMMSSSDGFWTLDLASWAALALFRRLRSSPLHSKMQCDSRAIKVP